MEGYLGDFPVDTAADPDFANLTKTDYALMYIEMYGQIDGAHHKQWVLDQVARILNDAPVAVRAAKWDNGYTEFRYRVGTCKAYEDWVLAYKGETDEDGETEYGYDEGIAP